MLRYSGIVFSRVSGDKTEEACREIKAAAYVEKSEGEDGREADGKRVSKWQESECEQQR